MSAFEKHYNVKEIATLWHLSTGVVRALFRDRADVIHIGHAERITKRAYVTLSIPESVVAKVYAELGTVRSGSKKCK